MLVVAILFGLTERIHGLNVLRDQMGLACGYEEDGWKVLGWKKLASKQF